jgi:hypothetical protein
MAATLKPFTTLVDFLSGRAVPNIGAEENRQALARYLVEEKGFAKSELEADLPLAFTVDGEPYRSAVDLVATVASRRLIAFKCAAGSLGSREREILAAARLLEPHPAPFAVASDGRTAVVLDTRSGKPVGEGLGGIPSRAELAARIPAWEPRTLSAAERRREQLIFRTYDRDNVNVAPRRAPFSPSD